eukprot:761408-Hanusia_phi.AAC.2
MQLSTVTSASSLALVYTDGLGTGREGLSQQGVAEQLDLLCHLVELGIYGRQVIPDLVNRRPPVLDDL